MFSTKIVGELNGKKVYFDGIMYYIKTSKGKRIGVNYGKLS